MTRQAINLFLNLSLCETGRRINPVGADITQRHPALCQGVDRQCGHGEWRIANGCAYILFICVTSSEEHRCDQENEGKCAHSC